MAKVVDTKQKRWVEFLPFVTAAYNSTAHGTTSFSQYFLLFGRELVLAVDIAPGSPRPPSCSINDNAYHTRERIAEALPWFGHIRAGALRSPSVIMTLVSNQLTSG